MASNAGRTVTGRSRPASTSCRCLNSSAPFRAGLWNRPPIVGQLGSGIHTTVGGFANTRMPSSWSRVDHTAVRASLQQSLQLEQAIDTFELVDTAMKQSRVVVGALDDAAVSVAPIDLG